MRVGPENEPERGRQRPVERQHRVGRDPAEQRARLLAVESVRGQAFSPTAVPAARTAPAPAGGAGTWTTGRRSSEASFSPSRTSGPNSRRQARPSAPPRPAAVAGHGPLEDHGPAAVERVGDRRVGVDQLDAAGREVDRPEERRGEGQRQDRRADVVAEPGQRQLGGPGPAAGRVGGLVDADRAPGTGQGDRRGQAVGPGADDDGIDCLGPALRRPGPLTGAGASPPVGELADGRGERAARRADRGAVPDVPPVPPLALPVDADAHRLDDRRGRTHRGREIPAGWPARTCRSAGCRTGV